MSAKNNTASKPSQNVIPLDGGLQAELERLRAENEALKAKVATGGKVTLKVSEKGGISAYGLGRFPVTLYREQWVKLMAMKEEVLAFIQEHDKELKVKGASAEGK